MFQIFRKKRLHQLVWQYLDGVIPPDRFRLLEESLQRWSWARSTFVDCAVLNALLTAYFNPEKYKSLPSLKEMIAPGPAYECAECNLDLDAELEQIEAELEAAERPKRKRPAV